MAILKRLLGALALVLLSSLAMGADVYFDSGCPDGGDGTTDVCDGTAAGNPFDRIEDVFAAGGTGNGACSTTYHLRGQHAAHGSCAGSDGHYYGREWALGATCAAETRSFIQPYNYATTPEIVFLNGTRATSGTWTQCVWSASCQAPCASITDQTMCEQTWYLDNDTGSPAGFQSGGAAEYVWAQKDSGEITYNVSAITDLTNAHGGYRSSRCASPYTMIPCVDATDCPSGIACSGSSAEIDSFRDAAGPRLFVRWGASLPSKPYVPYQNGDTFAFKAAADYMTVRGVNMIAHEGSAIWNNNGSTFNVIEDFRVLFVRSLQGQGNAYGINTFGGQDLTIQDGEIAYTLDEGIHAEPLAAGATRLNIQRVWFHDFADTTVMGEGTGTSHCAIIAMTPNQPGPGCGAGDNCDWTGSFWQDNLCENTGASDNGLRIENCVRGLVVRNSIFRNTNSHCIVVDGSDGPAGGQTDNIEIYNNLLENCGGAGINFYCSCSVTDTLIYNNTIVEPVGRAIDVENAAGTCTGNIIRNNIFADADANKLINWTPTDATNLLEFNLFDTSANPAITWAPATPDDYACADVVSAGTGNVDACTAGPGFVSATDFHILTSSPAKDAGTSTGMPAGRTTDINNTLADDHGLPSYADADACSGVCDIGVDEFMSAGNRPGCCCGGSSW